MASLAGGEPMKRAKAEGIITEARAISVARALFPGDYHSGIDCRSQIGKKGEPCDICAGQIEYWNILVNNVREAMIEAFRTIPKE
jgi:hypothetical protein